MLLAARRRGNINMIELFPNISDKLREDADAIWNIALTKKSPEEMAETLNNFVNYTCSHSDELYVREFLNFYFTVKMEEILKNEDDSSER